MADQTDAMAVALAQLATLLDAPAAPTADTNLQPLVDQVNRYRAGRGERPVSLAWLAEHALRAAGLTRQERKDVWATMRVREADD